MPFVMARREFVLHDVAADRCDGEKGIDLRVCEIEILDKFVLSSPLKETLSILSFRTMIRTVHTLSNWPPDNI